MGTRSSRRSAWCGVSPSARARCSVPSGAKVETLFGGHISILTTLCERARADAFDILLAHAQRRGANAVVGVRYDATEIMSGVTEVLCYGTAVIVEPLPRRLPAHDPDDLR